MEQESNILEAIGKLDTNPKNVLQEWCQKRAHAVPTYQRETLPNNAGFKITVVWGDGEQVTTGVHSTVKEAEKVGATMAIRTLGVARMTE